VNGIRKSYGHKVNFVYVEMDHLGGKERAREERIMGTPTFLFLDRAGERAYLFQGAQSRETLEKYLDILLAQE